MTKQLTPIKRYQSLFQELREQTAQFFRETGLNKVEPKHNRYAWRDGGPDYTKGVENDFIMIFSDPKKQLSFAFSFNYEDMDLPDQKVMASIKKGKENDSIESSPWMSLTDFKSMLSSFNKNLKTLPVSQFNTIGIIECFSQHFLEKKLDLNNEIKKQQEHLNELIENKSQELKIPDLKKKAENAKQRFESVNNTINEEIENSDDFKKMQLLEKEISLLKTKIEQQRFELQSKLKFKELKMDNEKKQYSLKEAQAILEHEVHKEIKKSPKMVAKKLKK